MNGVAPDLIAYFGNLAWRSIGSVGDGRVQVRENDTGPDDANHARYGIAIFAGPGMPTTVPPDARLFDIAPTVLTALGPARAGRHAGPEPGLIDPAALLDELRTLAYEGRAYADRAYDQARYARMCQIVDEFYAELSGLPARWSASGSRPTWARPRRRSARRR